jgi:hypothetical protein
MGVAGGTRASRKGERAGRGRCGVEIGIQYSKVIVRSFRLSSLQLRLRRGEERRGD